MENSEDLSVQWDGFSENLSSYFRSLREDTEFTDVTLVCEYGQQRVEAHKMILAGSSPVFHNLFAGNRQMCQVVYLRGVQLNDLAAVLDYIYLGEASLPQEELQSLLEECDLKVKEIHVEKESSSRRHRSSCTIIGHNLSDSCFVHFE